MKKIQLQDRERTTIEDSATQPLFSVSEAYDENTIDNDWSGLNIRSYDENSESFVDTSVYYDSAETRDKDMYRVQEMIESQPKTHATKAALR